MTAPTPETPRAPNEVPGGPPAAPPPPAASAATSSWWEDFVDVFYAPSDVFDRRRLAGFGVPLLIITLLTTALFFAARPVMSPIFEAQMEEQTAKMMESDPRMAKMTDEQKSNMLATQRKVAAFAAPVGALVGTPVVLLLMGVGIWLVAKVLDAAVNISQAILIAIYSSVPGLLQFVAWIVQGFLTDTTNVRSIYPLSMSLARFMNADTASPVALALAGRFDLFGIWGAVLTGIGLRVIGRLSREKAIVGAILIWVLVTLVTLLGALRQQAANG